MPRRPLQCLLHRSAYITRNTSRAPDIGAGGGGSIEVALAFSQRREIFPRQGAPRFFSIFFDLVLDPHNCRRHFRLAGNLGSNSRSLLEIGRDCTDQRRDVKISQRPCRRSPNMSAVEGRPAVPSGSGNFSACTGDILQLKEMACQSPRLMSLSRKNQWILCPVKRSRPCQNSQTGHHSPS